METTEKARELINKHLTIEGGEGCGISDPNVYAACLGAVTEALNIASVVISEERTESICDPVIHNVAIGMNSNGRCGKCGGDMLKQID